MALNPDLFSNIYKPDVLSCLADLSNDEVFTSPELANQLLEMLPQELFRDPNTTFLDPACKSGVFLREIAKRLIAGLADKIPNLQERCDWIFQHQLYGIAITELTSLLSRRSVYCSKYPNSPFSITQFDSVDGNIKFHKIKHTWDKKDKGGKCIYCGTAEDGALNEITREGLESHAYEFIHTLHPEEIFNMKFDVVISNVPYQLDTNGAGKQAKPIYNLFIEQAKKLNPRYMTMIIPSRWFAGGMGLDKFRDDMMHDKRLRKIVDYTNAKDCFPGISVSGGVCYFLWDRDNPGDCQFTNITNGTKDTMTRSLDELPVLVRYNKAISIIHKVNAKNDGKLADIISSLMPFGLSTSYRGKAKKGSADDLTLQASDGVTYIKRTEISKGSEYVDKYKILVSKTSAEHAGEPGKDGTFRVIPTSMRVMRPGEVCTHSYFLVGCFDTEEEAQYALNYLKTRFVRFLMLLSMSGFGLSKLVFNFVPMQTFDRNWTDEMLYEKYDLTDVEIEFIKSMIKSYDGEE